ncbi:MAG: GAF domain-containing protein [Alphaproteobacteria bacterium]|nr:GAF domain-containing protein [Alphaproteobacteria bacterium]
MATLDGYDILDTPGDAAFDRITRLATKLFETPIALVSLIDKDRQWFKSRQGLEAEKTPRNVAFCAHAIRGTDVFVVNDATRDPRFSDNPLVVADPGIRFYAGAPLMAPNGQNLGTLCVIDRKPRDVDDDQKSPLADLTKMVMDE